MGEYANAFFQGFNAVRAIGDKRNEDEARGEAYAESARAGDAMAKLKSEITVRKAREAAVGETAALPVGLDTPVAAIPTLTAASDMSANADVAGGAPTAIPVAAPAAPAVPAPAPAPASAPAAALPVAAATPAAPAGAPAVSPVDPNAPIVGADSDELASLQPATLDYVKVGGMLARGNFTPAEAASLIADYNSVGNALAEKYLGLASVKFGTAEAGNAVAALMEANNHSGNYRSSFDPASQSYIVVDLNADDPMTESHVFNKAQIDQLLQQASAGKSPITAYNESLAEMATNAMKAKADLITAGAGVTRAETAQEMVGVVKARDATKQAQDAAEEKGRNDRAAARLALDLKKLGITEALARQKAAKEGLSLDAFIGREVYYKSNPVFRNVTAEVFGKAFEDLSSAGYGREEALATIARNLAAGK